MRALGADKRRGKGMMQPLTLTSISSAQDVGGDVAMDFADYAGDRHPAEAEGARTGSDSDPQKQMWDQNQRRR